MPAVLDPEKYPADVDEAIEGPSIFLDPSAFSLLPGDVTVLTQFLQLIRRDVLREQIPATRIEIRGSVDPEDDTGQITVRVWVRGLAEVEIRRYYHALGERIDRWTAQMPEAQRLYFLSRLSFQVRRDADA